MKIQVGDFEKNRLTLDRGFAMCHFLGGFQHQLEARIDLMECHKGFEYCSTVCGVDMDYFPS